MRTARLFALLGADPPAGAAGLPVIDDRRAASAGLSVDRKLDAVDLDAATRLASLVPADVGSSAVSLAVVVTDANGFILETRPKGWSAVFGFYTPSLRTTELIPGQVRLLRSLLDRPRAARRPGDPRLGDRWHLHATGDPVAPSRARHRDRRREVAERRPVG